MPEHNTPPKGRKLGLVLTTLVATSLAAGCGEAPSNMPDAGALSDAAPLDAETSPDAGTDAAIDAALARVDAASVDAGTWEDDAGSVDAYYPDGVRG